MTDTIPTPIEAGNIELEESKDQQHEKKRTRFRSPLRHILKRKTDDEQTPPYCRLKEQKQYSDLQFKESPAKVPVYAIILAAVLFLIGSIMITLGALLLTGRIETEYKDRTWPLILVGTLVFLPGFYHLRIAYWAWKGDQNFSFADIPDLDWF